MTNLPTKPTGVNFQIANLRVGVETVTHMPEGAEVHLPDTPPGGYAPRFSPMERALDEVLKRRSLDERLFKLLEPSHVDPDLLNPSTLANTRYASIQALLAKAEALENHRQEAAFEEQRTRDVASQEQKRWSTAGKSNARQSELLRLAASYLQGIIVLDEDVRKALAALLRG